LQYWHYSSIICGIIEHWQGQAWLHTSEIPELGKLRQEDHGVQGHPGNVVKTLLMDKIKTKKMRV
jgi:hypothetical protein